MLMEGIAMTLNFDQYKEQKLTEYKEKNNRFLKKLRNILLTSFIVPTIIYLDILLLKSPGSSFSILIVSIYSFFVSYWVVKISNKRTTFKENLLYYIWNCQNFLDKYIKEGGSNEDRKKSLFYFQRLRDELNRFPLISKFEIEKPINSSLKLLYKWINRFVIPVIKKHEIKEVYSNIIEILNNSFILLQDENFVELEKLLKKNVQPHIKKTKNPFKKLIEWVYASRNRCLVFYGVVTFIIFSVAMILILYFELGLNGILGFCGIVSAVVIVAQLIQSHLTKKFQSETKK